MSYAVNAWNAVGETPPDLPKGNLPEPKLAEAYGRPHSTQEINDILKDIYAVRGDPSREPTLVFHGTPDEFAFFKARLCEWAKKRIST